MNSEDPVVGKENHLEIIILRGKLDRFDLIICYKVILFEFVSRCWKAGDG